MYTLVRGENAERWSSEENPASLHGRQIGGSAPPFTDFNKYTCIRSPVDGLNYVGLG